MDDSRHYAIEVEVSPRFVDEQSAPADGRYAYVNAPSVAAHPITLLTRLRFRVTVNTDNRLMSGTSMSRELGLLVEQAGWHAGDLRRVAVDAMKFRSSMTLFSCVSDNPELFGQALDAFYARPDAKTLALL